MIKAALNNRIVTPDHALWQAGGATRKAKATGVYSDVKVFSLVIQVDDSKIVFTTLDTVALSDEAVDQLRNRISEATGIDYENVYVIVTHTHSAPMLKEADKDDDRVDLEYRAYVFDEAVAVSKDSAENLKDVSRVTVSTGEIYGFYGNRDSREKPGDQQGFLLKFYGKDDELVAAMVNIHCHPTFLNQSWLLISADMAGGLRKYLAKELGIEPLYASGTTGDMSSRFYRRSQDYFELERCSKGIADAILGFTDVRELDLKEIKTVQEKYIIHREQDLDEYRRKLDEALAQQPLVENDPVESRLVATKITKFRQVLKENNPIIHVELNTSIINMGDLQIVTFNNDPVVSFGKAVKNASKAKCCFTLNHCNGEVGYLVEKEDFNTGYIGNVTKALPGQAEEYIENIIKKL